MEADSQNDANTAKKQKIEDEGAETTMTKPTEIVDLNDDCLAEIFKYLNCDELINIVDISGRFKVGARLAFPQVFRERPLTVAAHYTTGHDALQSDILTLWEKPNLLADFGSAISKLVVLCGFTLTEELERLGRAVIENCRECLAEVEFQHFDSHLFSGIDISQQSFTNVNKVCFNECTLDEFLFDFNTWFPKVQHLELKKVRFRSKIETMFIEQHFPMLTQLTVISFRRASPSGKKIIPKHDARFMVTNENLMNIIDLNPQITGLTIMHNKNIAIRGQHQLFASINRKLPQLESLHLIYDSDSPLKVVPEDQLRFNGLKVLTFDLLVVGTLGNLWSISANQLEHLVLCLEGFALETIASYRPIEDFIVHFPSVRKITIRGNLAFCKEILKKMIELPQLKEVDLISVRPIRLAYMFSFRLTHVLPLLFERTKLEKISIRTNCGPQMSNQAFTEQYNHYKEVLLDRQEVRAANWNFSIVKHQNTHVQAVGKREIADNRLSNAK